jgi:prevent-host-death family protein
MDILVVTKGLRRADVAIIQASKFKARCLALMDEVARTGETLTITKNGKPVAELRPHRPPRAKSLIGLHKGDVSITGDIVSSVDAELWEASV